jgi:hypothetical protein
VNGFADVSQAFTHTMSSQLTSLVTVFNGQNWGNWSHTTKAFLMAQGLWRYINGHIEEPSMPTLPTAPTAPAPLASGATKDEEKAFKEKEKDYKDTEEKYKKDLKQYDVDSDTLSE